MHPDKKISSTLNVLRKPNADEFKQHNLLISCDSEYKNCHTSCKLISRKAAQLTVCCGLIYAIVSVDLSCVIYEEEVLQ